MDFVSVWKALSIVVTGAFGILGLLRDFKDKLTNKITSWGKVSLIGILSIYAPRSCRTAKGIA